MRPELFTIRRTGPGALIHYGLVCRTLQADIADMADVVTRRAAAQHVGISVDPLVCHVQMLTEAASLVRERRPAPGAHLDSQAHPPASAPGSGQVWTGSLVCMYSM